MKPVVGGQWPQFVVVEGPIGVGKSALARKIAERFGSTATLERSDDNPFLERFYADRRRGALPAQLFCLFNRASDLDLLRQEDMFSPVRVADFLIARDRLFAEINLDPDELKLYDQVAASLDIEVPAPDLVIYLQAPVATLRARINARNPESGSRFDDTYLEQVADAYTRFFFAYDDSPLLIVNVAAFDPVANSADFDALFEQIVRSRRGRHFFNPITSAAMP
ncbi:MAG: deoxynucleoside kinase [Pseudomonadota bacterium]